MCADDFTSRGGHADGAIGAKSFYLDQLSLQMQIPSIRLLDGSSGGGSVTAMVPQQKQDGESTAKESTGAIEHGKPRVSGGGGSFLPGHLGSTEYAEQLATVPVVNVLLGSVVGIGAAKAVLGHFSVMVRDISQLFVAGPPVVSHAMGYDITKEDLGGWQVHCRNGSVDNLAETEEEAVAMTKRFLSYLPSSVYEAPPVVAPTDPADRREEELLTIIPRKRTTTFDVRRVIELLADRGSWFEIGGAVGHRSGRRAGPLRRPSGRRHRIRQPPHQRRRPDRRRLRQADPPPRRVRPVPPADPQPHRQPRLHRRPRARAGRHDPQGRRVDGGHGPGAGADVLGADAAQLRRRRQQPGDADPAPERAGDVAGGRRRRHPAGGRHRGGLQAPARRGRGSGGAARRAGGPHRERRAARSGRSTGSRSRR